MAKENFKCNGERSRHLLNVTLASSITHRSGGESNPTRADMIRPSEDPASIAKHFRSEIPFHLRQLIRSTANPEEVGDLISYLLFSPGYVKALMKLGEKDAKTHHEQIEKGLQL
jgi:hypothetical protein